MNPLDKKFSLSLGEIIKIAVILGTLYAGGIKFYGEFKIFRGELKHVAEQLQYIHEIFKEAEAAGSK